MAWTRDVVLIGGGGSSFGSLESQLKRAGAPVTPIIGVEAAKDRFTKLAAGMVVVSMDVSERDPVDLIRELVFLFRGTPVIAAATGGSVTDAKQVINAGAADYLLLPIEDREAAGLLERYADYYFDPELGRGRTLITSSDKMRQILTQVRRVAQSKATVLIQGESGTGKELIARYVHQTSDRVEGPMVSINCAALPDNLLESELFGHAKGAFTGAVSDRKGKFQQADKGTIFLDEISEMSMNLQAKLLRVLQEGEVDPVGGKTPVTLDVRVVASTNRDLKDWVAQGSFREDLYYRLNVFPVTLPPLREREGDVLLLAEHFRKRFVKELGRNDVGFSKDAKALMAVYQWEGNVRELENVVQRALLVAAGSHIEAGDLMIQPPAGGIPAAAAGGDGLGLAVGTTVREMEELLIMRTLDEVKGNRTQAAKLLGISIRTLRNKLNEYEARPEV